MYKVYAVSDIGLKREENQDGFYVDGIISCGETHREIYYESDADCIHVVVCDGVGSTVYAKYAVERAFRFINNNHVDCSEKSIENFVQQLNKYVYDSAKTDNKTDSATTIVGLLIKQGVAYSYNIGDSALFTINKGYLEKHSVDDAGMASIGIVKNYGEEQSDGKPPLLQSIGTNESIDIVHIKKISNEDVYLLATDGIFDLIEVDEIEDIIEKNDSMKEIAQALVEKANGNGGYDNSTVALVVDEHEE